MPVTKLLTYKLFEAFQTDEVKDAKAPFGLALTSKNLKQGARFNVLKCPYQNCALDAANIASALVTEHYTYLRFKGKDKSVYRYQNSTEMTNNIRLIDEGHADEVEPGEYILEVPKGARSLEYKRKRNEDLKNGKRKVVPRGPNKNPRRRILHLRPF